MNRAVLFHDHAEFCLSNCAGDCFQTFGAEGCDPAIGALRYLIRASGFKHLSPNLRFWIECYACDNLDEIKPFLKSADILCRDCDAFGVPLRVCEGVTPV